MRCYSKTIHIFYNSSNKCAGEIVDEIYTQFSFSKDNILSPNIGYSVRLYGSVDLVNTYCIGNTDENNDDLYIFIATSDMGRNVQQYVDAYNTIYDNNHRTMIISLVQNTYFFDAKNFSINTYMLKEDLVKRELPKLMCIIAQKLLGKKVCLFLSYCRKDGSDICKKFKNALSATPGFQEFMDIKDIEFGIPIQNEIERYLNSSILICFSTDKYSERFWGTEELLLAKQNNLPIIVVDCLSSIEQRRNPNSGNVPVVRENSSDFEKFVHETVLLAVKEKLRKQIADESYSCDSKILSLWKAPELYDIRKAEITGKDTIMYPSPPICRCETEYYSRISDICLVLDNGLHGLKGNKKKICLSFSKAELSADIHPFYFDNLLSEIIRYSIYGEYQLLYGGDWRAEGFTEKILDYCEIYQSRDANPANFLVNYYANLKNADVTTPYSKIRNWGEINEIRYSDLPIEKQSWEEDDRQAELLSTMRRKMIGESDAVIIFGGKEKGSVGYTSGVAEEVSVAYSLGKTVYLIGSVGGATAKIIRMINGSDEKFSPSFSGENAYDNTININQAIKSIKVEDLSKLNRLTIEENRRLFHSIDIKEIIRLIFGSLL